MNQKSTKFYQEIFEWILLLIIVLLSFDTTRVVIRLLQSYLALAGISLTVLHKLGEKKSSYYLKAKYMIGWLFFWALITVQIMKFDGINGLRFYPFLYGFGLLLSTMWVRDCLIDRYLKIIKVVIFVGGISILTEMLFPDMMYQFFWFLFEFSKGAASYVQKTVAAELYIGAYSGFFGEKSDAAFLLSVGIVLIMAGMLAYKRIRATDILLLLVMYVAMLLTGKRMLFLVSILIPLIMLALSDVRLKKKFVICITGSVIVLLIGCILISVIPELNTIFERLASGASGEDAAMTERYYFWGICYQMFKSFPIFGFGFSKFSIFARSFKGVGVSYAHNIYIELLGETGIVGVMIFLFAVCSMIYLTCRLYRYKSGMKKNEKMWYYYAIAVQMIFLFYGLTGNGMYYWFEIFAYFVAAFILNNLYYRHMIAGRLKEVCYPCQQQ